MLVVYSFHEQVDFAKVVQQLGRDDARQLFLYYGDYLEQVRVARVAFALPLVFTNGFNILKGGKKCISNGQIPFLSGYVHSDADRSV